MYGTLKAAGEFQDTLNGALCAELEMIQGSTQPCLFYDPVRQLELAYHGDDLAIVAEKEDILEFAEILFTVFEGSIKYMIGDEIGDDKEAVILNRIVTIVDAGRRS